MSWISTNNLRRFADNLFHGKLSFSGNVTHNGAVEFNGGIKVNTVKAEFTAPVSFAGTVTYENNEIATKADVAANSITVDDALSRTSTNPVQNRVIAKKFDGCIDYTEIYYTAEETMLGSCWFPLVGLADNHLWQCPIDTLYNGFSNRIGDMYAVKNSPTFTGTVTAPNVIVSTSLTIPGGKLWVE